MIKTTMVGFDDGGAIFQCDTIKHEDALWLVPDWLHNTKEGWMQPVRIIRLTGLRYQETQGGAFGDYILNDPMPRAVFDGKATSVGIEQFAVIERPDIRFPAGQG